MIDSYKRLNEYYNKFNEGLRLTRRHGIVELSVTLHYIKKYSNINKKIIDVGCGVGRYSDELTKQGFDVTSVEVTQSNISKAKNFFPDLKIIKADARNLKIFSDKSFDMVLLLGPIYHCSSYDDRLKIISEAKRILRDDGLIFIAYYLNDYAIIKHAFIEEKYFELKERIDNDFLIKNLNDLYCFDTIESIDALNKDSNLKSIERFSQEYITDLIRDKINKMSDEMFKLYIDFVISRSNNVNILGASSHIVDITTKISS